MTWHDLTLAALTGAAVSFIFHFRARKRANKLEKRVEELEKNALS